MEDEEGECEGKSETVVGFSIDIRTPKPTVVTQTEIEKPETKTEKEAPTAGPGITGKRITAQDR